jgi:hypothetical protein
MKERMLEVHKEPNLCQKLGAFDYGTNGVYRGGVWGSNCLDDHSKQSKDQCVYVLNTNDSTTSPNCFSIDTI